MNDGKAAATPDGLPPLREVIRSLDLSARKSLGQNFILDLNLTRRIARAASPLAGRTVVEVGPGPGGLTRALLLEGAARVVVVEQDERCEPALQAIGAHYPGRLVIHTGDARHTDWHHLLPNSDERAIVVANLPYSVGTNLLTGWLEEEPWPPWYDHLVLMFQKEVADRITAHPGTKAYGRLSVLAQWRCVCRQELTLPPAAFTPPPKVSSALVSLVPRPNPEPPCDAGALSRVTAAAFGQRRKMLRSSLKSLVNDPEPLLAEAGIDGHKRAEDLAVAEFARLALAFEARQARHSS